jgi:hypothetical protein
MSKICGNLHDSSEIVKCHFSTIFWLTLWTLQIADHFTLHWEHLFTYLWTFYTIILQFLHSLHFGHKSLHIIYNGMLQHSCFVTQRKQITPWILQLVGLSIAGHIITQSVETRTNTRWPVMWCFTRQWVMWCYITCTCSPLLLHYLPKMNRGYLPNSPDISL